ncbi:MAG: hypothetical protein U1G07_14155 [Verrucomicrobiota bacterium]
MYSPSLLSSSSWRHGAISSCDPPPPGRPRTPLSRLSRKIRGQGESFLFESVEGGEHIGRYSFVGRNPQGIVRQTGAGWNTS